MQMDNINSESPKNKKKHRWSLLICALAFVVMILYLVLGQEGEQLLHAVEQFKVEYLFVILALMVSFWVLEALTTQILLRIVWRKQTFPQTMTITMIGQYYNCITPLSSGGQPMQAYYMRRYGTPASVSMTVLLARLTVYEFTLTLYSVVVLVLKFTTFSNGVLLTLALIGFAMNAAGIFMFMLLAIWKNGTVKCARAFIHFLAKIRLVKKEEETKKKVSGSLEEAYTNMRFVLKHPLPVLAVFGITVVQLTLLYGVSYAVYLGFSALEPAAFTQDPFTVISCQAMVNMVSAMFPLPGAVGLTESSYVVFFREIYPATQGAAVNLSMFVWRFFTFYLQIVIGIVITLVISFRGKSAPVSVAVGEETRAEGGSLEESERGGAEESTEENAEGKESAQNGGDIPPTGDEV
jgi:uncharacterized protein (TIRG00374 family)